MNKKGLLLFALSAGLVLTGCGDNTSSSSKTNTGSSSSSSTSDSSEYWSETDSGKNADGYADFSELDWKEKSKILYSLEKYSMENFTGGIPLYDDASFEQFSKRITLPSTKYQTNYGFGTGYGTIDPAGDMYDGPISEAKSEWKSYFHGYTNTDSGTFNGWDSTGSDVTDRMSMITSGYFGVKANAANTSYSWVGSLSKTDAPIMLDASGNVVDNPSEDQTSQFWRVKLHYGKGYTYHTSSTSKYKKYDGREVALEDYLTPFKAMLNNRLTRFAELVSDTSGFQGAMEYVYNTSAHSKDWKESGVGIQINEEEGALDFTFIQPKSKSFARTSLSSGLYSPIPQEFLDDIGGAKNYGTYVTSSNGSYTDVFDNILSFGPYVPEYWQKGKQLVFKRNADYFEASDYHFAGYSEVVFEGEKADEQAYQAFLKNELDEVTIPVSQLKNHKNDERVYRTEGSTIIKLNLNTTTSEEWEKLFGVNGTVYKHGEKNYWDTKPIMSNEYFLTGLYFSINRKELADAAGRNPAMAYLSNAYMLDPSGTQSYRDSIYGKSVIRPYQEASNNEYCYSADLAQKYFKRAGDQLIKNGDYERGEKITILGLYRYQTTIDNLGNYIKSYVEDNFNKANKESGLTLELKLEVAGSQYTDAYTKMDHGEFDFAEGAISGNVLNPLDFMSTISSTKSLNQGFCLNWGSPTDEMSNHPAIYQGMRYSFDALWSASQGFTPLDNGVSSPIAGNQEMYSGTGTEEGYVVFKATYPEGATDEYGRSLYEFSAKDVALLFGNTENTESGYTVNDSRVKFSQSENGYIKMVMPKDLIQSLANQAASSSSSQNVQYNYFNIYFALVYKITRGNNVITKSIQISSPGKFVDFGMTPAVKNK